MALTAALAALSCFPRLVRAEVSTAAALALEFQADPACPDAADFLAQIHARTPIRASDDPGALRLSVALHSSSGGFTGELRRVGADGGDTREVTAATCEEVADALALIGALMVERSKRKQAERPPTVVRRPSPSPPVAVARAAPARRSEIALGIEALIARPMTSAPLAGVAVSLLVDGGLTWWLSAGYARNDALRAPELVRLGYGAVTLAIGPPSLRLGARLRLAGGLGAEGGFLAAEGVDVDIPASARRSYWALGLLARLQWRLVDHGNLFVQGAGLIPLVERGFSTREPYRRVSTTALIAPKVGVGISLGF